MVKKQTKSRKRVVNTEPDSTYFLKLVMFVVLGSFWLKFAEPIALGPVVVSGFPLGLLLGIVFASHDHFQIDRKIEYAILVLITVLTYFVPAGIVI